MIAIMLAGAVATLISLFGTRFLIVFFRRRGEPSVRMATGLFEELIGQGYSADRIASAMSSPSSARRNTSIAPGVRSPSRSSASFTRR